MKKLLIPFFIIGTVAMIIVMGKTGKPLKTAATPNGIVNLEFAYNTSKIDSVFKAWKSGTPESKVETAKTNTYWDFVFIFFYSGLLFLSCNQVVKIYRHNGALYNAGKVIAKLAVIAGVLDIIENCCMLQSLAGNSSNVLALAAAVCAAVKFTFIIVAILYILLSLLYRLIIKPRNS